MELRSQRRYVTSATKRRCISDIRGAGNRTSTAEAIDMEDWQIAVLNSENIRVDQDASTGYRIVIRKTDGAHSMTIPDIVERLRKCKRKPVIMFPDDPKRGMFADKRQVLDVLTATEEYQEYMIWKVEAKMNGVI